MKKADICEFQDHALALLFGKDSLEITSNGRTIGYFIPMKAPHTEEAHQAMARLGEAVERLRAETGLTEDELVESFTNWRS